MIHMILSALILIVGFGPFVLPGLLAIVGIAGEVRDAWRAR